MKLLMVCIIHIEAYVKFSNTARGLTRRRREERKASARLCAVLWSDLRFYGMPCENFWTGKTVL